MNDPSASNESVVLKWYTSASDDDQCRFLLHLVHGLTIQFRGCYSEDVTDIVNAPLAIRINEIQHRLVSAVAKIQAHDEKRYPPEVLMSFVLCRDPDPEIDNAIHSAVARAARLCMDNKKENKKGHY